MNNSKTCVGKGGTSVATTNMRQINQLKDENKYELCSKYAPDISFSP